MKKVILVAGVHPSRPRASGVRAYVRNIARGLHERGYEVHLVGVGPRERLAYGEFHTLTSRIPISQYEFAWRLVLWLKNRPPLSGAIIHVQRPDDLIPFLVRTRDCGYICTLHGEPFRGVNLRRPFGKFLYAGAERFALAKATRVISVSKTGLESYLHRYPWLADKMEYVPIGIDTRSFNSEASTSLFRSGGEGKRRLLFAGRLEREKRVHVLLEACRDLRPSPAILIAGTGTLEAELRNHPGASNANFLGVVSSEDMPKLMASVDALVLPSAYEGMPTVALEALACGTPVISTRVGDLGSVIVEGQNGFFFDGSSVSLSNVLNNHLGELTGMRRACASSVSAYDVRIVLDRIECIYEGGAVDLLEPRSRDY